MLKFTRKAGQAIRIGDDIVVTVQQVRGRQVRVSIEAPREVPVFREELYQQIAEENKQAVPTAPDLLDRLD